MNIANRLTFEGILLRTTAFKTKVGEVLGDFAAKKSEAEAESRKYSSEYQKTFLEEKNKQLVNNARQRLNEASAEFQKKTRADAATLRNELLESLKQPVPAELESHLRAYREFGIKPSRTQAEVLLQMANGNPLALSAIDAVLADKSPYRVQRRPVSDFEDDLVEIERLARCAERYVPLEHLSAGVAVWSGTPVKNYRSDGSTFENGTVWDAVGLNTNSTAMSFHVKKIEGLAPLWSGDVTTEISDRVTEEFLENERREAEEHERPAPVQPDDKPTAQVADTQRSAVALAADLGKDQAADNAKATAFLNRYAR